MKAVKSVKAWAIVTPKGKPFLVGGELPIFWRQSAAKWVIEHEKPWLKNYGVSVAKVEIREVKPRRKHEH